ncbi:MAG: hypothetical protein LH473_11810 [Chitinophagales bacterium]|nr:hypothetical protein [Chitinophagales bacterium]
MQKADFVNVRVFAFSFSVENKEYIDGGDDGYITYKDLWEYNPVTDRWTQKADFAGGGRENQASFTIGSKAYLGTGEGEFNIKKKDFWEYDPSLNLWNQRADFGGLARRNAFGFSIGGFAYIGLGRIDSSIEYINDLWEYDPTADQWAKKTDYPGNGNAFLAGFAISGKQYVGTGLDGNNSTVEKDFWQYNPDSSTFIEEITTNISLSVFPNPLTTSAVISFSLYNYSKVSIDQFESSGKKIRTLLKKELQNGKQQILLNRENLIAGIYLLQLKLAQQQGGIKEETIVKKIIIE